MTFNSLMRRAVSFVFVIAFAAAARAATPTIIEDADGKRVLEMDDPSLNTYQAISKSGGTSLVYVQGDEILLKMADPAILVIDGDAVRPSPAGVRIATFDGDSIRHADISGKVMIAYQHPDICPDSASNRIYRVTGPRLTRAQLVAVLYVLKPELFKLSDEEIASQKKAIAEAGAEEDRKAAEDHVARKWEILNGHGPVEKINQGTITFAPKKNDVYPVEVDYTKDGGAKWTGVAASKALFGDTVVWAAYGTPKSIGLCVYKIDGGKLTGTWHPWYDQGDPKNLGSEELKGPETLDGEFQIVTAKAPTTGAAYTGTVTIKPLDIVGAGDDEKPYSVTWTFGATKVVGIGIRTKDFLYVATGGADVMIAKYTLQGGGATFNGDFFKLGSTEMGGQAAMN